MMDNKKIGKLIKELRKEKGLTQEQLGEMIGVSFKSVSKWERGITIPDIGNINELSKILGISSDELLAGERNTEESVSETNKSKKVSSKIIITISIIAVFIIAIILLINYQNNKTYVYDLVSAELDEYYIKGKMYINKDKISVVINNVYFKEEEFNNIVITNYEYSVNLKDKVLFGYGYIENMNFLERPTSIMNFLSTFNINFEIKKELTKREIIKNNIILKFRFVDINENEIIKEQKILIKNK